MNPYNAFDRVLAGLPFALLILLLVWLFGGCHSTDTPRPRAPVSREMHYDAQGRFIGTSEKRGNRRINYDSSGRWIGHTEQHQAQQKGEQ